MKKLLNIGYNAANEESLSRKIRISNLISLITIVYMAIFTPLSISFHITGSAETNIIFLLISVCNFLLHKKGLHQLSFHISCIYGIVYFSLATIIFGLESSMHLFLLIMAMIVVMLFDEMLILKIYNFSIVAIFFILMMYMKNREGSFHLDGPLREIQKIINISNLFSLFLITIVFFIFFKRDNVLYQKLLLEQKKIVQEKQTEVIDSITYAKRIQDAILPPLHYWAKNLPQSFILYKPKDIVAGDFYWMEKGNDENHIFFAAADCTGHGVPGAMVSVVCNNALNRSLLEFNLTETGKILDKTRELVIETFGKSNNEVKDGMDISLCRLNTATLELQWSGANNPLWYIRNSELLEIKPNKQPIGNYTEQTSFTTHSLQLKKGDSLYIFSDGYADQFGGPKGKKFKYKQLEAELIRIHKNNPNDQKQILDKVFEDWKANLEQLDDVCIIGVQV
ncbi:hypothetical protein CNR22_05660 [Sphingobacteriaceae bacterium]|nr:hypothetical protein CNR22_05660 [Sphingobacteriaceae bacterium]